MDLSLLYCLWISATFLLFTWYITLLLFRIFVTEVCTEVGFFFRGGSVTRNGMVLSITWFYVMPFSRLNSLAGLSVFEPILFLVKMVLPGLKIRRVKLFPLEFYGAMQRQCLLLAWYNAFLHYFYVLFKSYDAAVKGSVLLKPLPTEGLNLLIGCLLKPTGSTRFY